MATWCLGETKYQISRKSLASAYMLCPPCPSALIFQVRYVRRGSKGATGRRYVVRAKTHAGGDGEIDGRVIKESYSTRRRRAARIESRLNTKSTTPGQILTGGR